MTGQAAARAAPRRSDAGHVRLTGRDVSGLLLCAEHYAAPYDLLAAALDAPPGPAPRDHRPLAGGRLRRHRHASAPAPRGAGSPRPGWPRPATPGRARPPALARLAHIRAVLAARLWLQAAPAYAAGRRVVALRAAHPRRPPRPCAAPPHVADAEIHWPSSAPGPHAGQVWAVEVELTPKPRRADRADHGRAAGPARLRAGRLPGQPRPPAPSSPRRPGTCPTPSGTGSRSATCPRPRSCPGPVTCGRSCAPSLLLWLLRQAFRLLRILLIVAVLVVLWPVTGAAAAAAAAAWALGWPAGPPVPGRRPVRADDRGVRGRRRAALPRLAGRRARPGHELAAGIRAAAARPGAPGRAAHRPGRGPAGLAAGGAVWAWRTAAVAAGAAGRHAFAPAVFDARQWRRQARAARGLLAAPGAVPLVTSTGMVPAGAVIRAVGRRWTPVLAVAGRARSPGTWSSSARPAPARRT